MNTRSLKKIISLAMVVVIVFGITIPASAQNNTDNSNNDKTIESLSDNLVNYIAITSSNQSLSDEQQVIIGIGNGNKNLTDGILTYKNNNTGDIYQVNRDDKSDEALSFTINYDGKEQGVYQLVGLEYTLDGNKNNIALGDADLAVTWGVGVEHITNPDDVIEFEESEEAADEVADEASSIPKALDAANGKLSVSGNGVINTKASKNDANNSEATVSDSGLSIASNDVINTGAGNVVIVLDPGHGGYDSGATCNGLLEKDLNLKVATYCKNALEQYGGVSVYMTRYDDTAPGYPVAEDLVNRVNIAQALGANALVSIHMNSGGGSGVEVYYPNANYNVEVSNIGRGLSQSIYNQIVALGMKERGIKIRNSSDGYHDYYSVIRNSKDRGFPGIIVEHAFIDGDNARLQDENFLRQLGEADARGIAEYFKLGAEDLSQYEGAFNVNIYRFFNQDLWGMTDQQCFEHWINTGIFEDRDGSPVFNMIDYVSNNPDLVEAFGFDFRAYARHFCTNGMSEGRKSIDTFSVQSYKNRYVDLRNAYGKDLRSYYIHYDYVGFSEGREATGYENTRIGSVTMLGPFDFGRVYDYDYYTNRYPDIKAAYGEDDIETLNHFVNRGIHEARQAKDNFNVTGYKNRYLDLRRCFGNDLSGYMLHYIFSGMAEGRDASYTSEVINPEYMYNGIDYSSVYNYYFYQWTYPDIYGAFGSDDMATINHFMNSGMNEGRRGSEEFDVWKYIANYQDLRDAFGWYIPGYYHHYVSIGKAEGRVAS